MVIWRSAAAGHSYCDDADVGGFAAGVPVSCKDSTHCSDHANHADDPNVGDVPAAGQHGYVHSSPHFV